MVNLSCEGNLHKKYSKTSCRREIKTMTTKKYNNTIVKDLGTISNLPTVKIQGNNKFAKLHKIIVVDIETGEVLDEVKDFEKNQEGNYFLKESCKKDAFLQGVLETRADLPASGYRKNEVRIFDGKKRFRMSAYFYEWSEDKKTMYRYTYDVEAAYGRLDDKQKVAEFRGSVLYVYIKKPKVGKKVNNPASVRTDNGKAHKPDNSPRAMIEKERRTPKRS